MKQKYERYDESREYRNNSKKIERIVNLFAEKDKKLLETVVDLLLGKKFNSGELQLFKIENIARIMKSLNLKTSEFKRQPANPSTLIQLETQGIDYVDKVLNKRCMASYKNVSVILPKNFVVLPHDGTAFFLFPDGAPLGRYAFWLAWYTVTGLETFEIYGHAATNPQNAVKPTGNIIKNTELVNSEYMFSGVDFVWHIVTDNDEVKFTIKNVSQQYVVCLGVSLIVSIP